MSSLDNLSVGLMVGQTQPAVRFVNNSQARWTKRQRTPNLHDQRE